MNKSTWLMCAIALLFGHFLWAESLAAGSSGTTCAVTDDSSIPAACAKCGEIDTLLSTDFATHPMGGLTVGVVSGNQLIWTKSYGQADMAHKRAASKDTIYRIGSITKWVTALMLEQLVDRGKVHLSDPVEKYFQEIHLVQGRYADAPPITLIQLATHTSGLGREPDHLDTYLIGSVSTWEKTLIAALPETHYQFEPGTRFSYSNIGYAILGAALSRAAGDPYVDYIERHLFKPLGMAHTTFDWNPQMSTSLAVGYEVDGNTVDSDLPQRETRGRGYKVPNGAIFTTVEDLGRLAKFLLGNGPDTVLAAPSLQRDRTKVAIQSDFKLSAGHGLGFDVLRRGNYLAVGHDGNVAGYQAALYLNCDANTGVIVLANSLGTGTVSTQDLALTSLDILSK